MKIVGIFIRVVVYESQNLLSSHLNSLNLASRVTFRETESKT